MYLVLGVYLVPGGVYLVPGGVYLVPGGVPSPGGCLVWEGLVSGVYLVPGGGVPGLGVGGVPGPRGRGCTWSQGGLVWRVSAPGGSAPGCVPGSGGVPGQVLPPLWTDRHL